jgi:hypothetical protein
VGLLQPISVGALVVLLAVALPVRAESRRLESPLLIAARMKDGTPLAGTLTEYDDRGFTLRSTDGQIRQLPWQSLEGRTIFAIHQSLLGRSATAGQWMALGQLLAELGDRVWSDAAFARAIHLDGTLSVQVAGIRSTARYHEPAAAPAPPRAVPDAGHVSAEPIGTRTWPGLTVHQSAQAVDGLKAFARRAQERIGHSGLRFYESRHFLLYTDLAPETAARCMELLEQMYVQLCGLFGVSQGTNIFCGRALVFAFGSYEHFASYEENVERTPITVAGVAGRCHAMGPWVRMAFYHTGDDLEFARIVVHEGAHGFLHRYRSPEFVTLWANEGLAEWTAHEVGVGRRTREQIRGEVRQALTDFMIQRNRSGYLAFMNAMKDGKPWPRALVEDFGMSVEELMAAYGVDLGVGPLGR